MDTIKELEEEQIIVEINFKSEKMKKVFLIGTMIAIVSSGISALPPLLIL